MRAHPIVDGTPLLLGDFVRVIGHPDVGGEVSQIRVRCWGNPGIEPEWIASDGRLVRPSRPWEQVWVHLNGDNRVFYPEELERRE